MVTTTTHFGGTASSILTPKVGHGTMTMTTRPDEISDEQVFAAIRHTIGQLPPGARAFLVSGEFYSFPPRHREANLDLLRRYFDRYPEDKDKVFISVKGAVTAAREPDCSEESIRKSVDNIITHLGDKRLDLFETARVDPKHPVEETIGILKKLVEEGKFDHIGVSEVSAQTLRRAHAVHPIAVVEIEVSPWQYDETRKELIKVARELGIAVAAYSPVGRGMFTGKVKSMEDIPKGSLMSHLTRFREENLKQNLELAAALESIATKKGITPAQLAIAWVSSLGPHIIPIPGSSHETRTRENTAAADVVFSEQELTEIGDALAKYPVYGGRFAGGPEQAYLDG